MRLPSLTQAAKGEAHFEWYSDGQLQYGLCWWDDASPPLPHDFKVTVPISDAGGGYFKPVMRGIELLRWIRKRLDEIKEAQKETQQG